MAFNRSSSPSCELIVADSSQNLGFASQPIIIKDYGIPRGCFNSFETFNQAFLKGLGCTLVEGRKTLDVQLKSASIQHDKRGREVRSSLRKWTVEKFCEHVVSERESVDVLNVLDIGTSFLRNAESWSPDVFCQNDLLTEIRGRLQLSAKRGHAFDLKQSWFLAADGGANSTLHFDSHGFSTFLLPLVGSFIVVYSTTNVTHGAERQAFLEYMRSWMDTDPDDQTSSMMERHLRYVVLNPGQLWFMPAGTLHAVIRDARTLIFGGHCIPMTCLPDWLTGVEESLRYYDSTNEDPAQLLEYIDCACQAVGQRQALGLSEELGGLAQVGEFWSRLGFLLRQPAAEVFDDLYKTNAVRREWDKWRKAMAETYSMHLML